MRQSPLGSLSRQILLFIFCSLFLLTSKISAQNASYNANSIPIGGGQSCAFGFNALFSQNAFSLGHNNTAIGYSAMYNNGSGNNNTAIGHSALYNNTIFGNYNTGIGVNSLVSNTIGYSNTGLGANSDVGSSNLTNATAIGHKAIVQNSNSIQLGDSAVTTIYSGVGTNTTFITGGLQVTGGSLVSGYVLTSNSTGVATWQAPNTGDDWHTTGNSGTLDGTNFIGTTDNVPFNIRVNNEKSGRIDQSSAATFYGFRAGRDNATGIRNTANGYESLVLNRLGDNNTAIGFRALYSNTKGSSNTAVGSNALFSSTEADRSTAVGYNALFANTAAGNTATGYEALVANTTGIKNTSIGNWALYQNTTGDFNTATGADALYSNTTGYDNCGLGGSALIANTTGYYNTGAGQGALGSNLTGHNNSGLGFMADVSVSNLNYATAIGSYALVNASNKVRLGDPTVTVVEGPVAYTISDERFKENIKEKEVKGLDFINRLRPVVYNFDTKKFQEFLVQKMPDSMRRLYLDRDFSHSTAIRQSGFIAQEVEKAAKEIGYDFNGIHSPESEYDNYSLAYSQFVVPLTKAVQELSKQNDDMKKEIDELKAMIKNITSKNEDGSIRLTRTNVDAQLFQNAPNPFSKSTIIKYSIPVDAKKAIITISSTDGARIKEFDLRNKNGQNIEITAGQLSVGAYIYSLIVDDRLVDSKTMILTK